LPVDIGRICGVIAPMITWIIFAAGGPVDSPWEKDVEVQAHTAQDALEQVIADGLDPANVQGIISEPLYEDLGLAETDGPEAEETETED